MPPIVGVHEGVAALPGVGHRFQEGHALQHLAARFQAMGDGVMRPRIAAVHRERLARDGLGLVEAIALLEAERIHGVDVAVVAIGREQMLADAQQRFGIAAIEGMELAELAGQQVARPFGRHVLVDLRGCGRSRRRSRPRSRRSRPLARRWRRRRNCLGAGEIALAPAAWPSAEFIDSMRLAAITGSRAQRCFLVGGGDELGQPVAEAQPLVA